MRSILLSLLAFTLLPLAGCNLYFSGGDDPDPCQDWGGAGQAPPAQLLRDPSSGICQDFGYTQPPYPCDGVCGPCVYPAGTENPSGGQTDTGTVTPGNTDSAGAPADLSDQAAMPSWGYCQSFCTGLDENSCLGTGGCQAIYDNDATGVGAGQYRECWQTDFSGPPDVQSCEGLDAYTCSRLDSCISVHEFPCDAGAESDALTPPECEANYFIACHNEPAIDDGCYSDLDCGQGSSCNADELCLPPPSNGPCPGDFGCDVPAVCYGYCVPDTDPGQCDGVVLCDALPPTCPEGSTPGIGASGCWTGQCIDLSLCPQASCGDIVGEAMCIARADCSPYYVGIDCTCDANGCDCADWAYDSCNQQ